MLGWAGGQHAARACCEAGQRGSAGSASRGLRELGGEARAAGGAPVWSGRSALEGDRDLHREPCGRVMMAGLVRGSRAGAWGPLSPAEPHLSPSEPWPRGRDGVCWSLVSLPSHHMSLPWASPAFPGASPSQLGSVPGRLQALSGAEPLAQGIQLPVLRAQREPLAARFPKAGSC